MSILTDDLTNYDTVSLARIQQLLEELESYVSGNITNTDISSNAAISTSKLASRHYEFDVNIPLPGWDQSGSDGDLVAAVPFPYDSAGGLSYTVEGVEVAGITSTIGGSPTFDVEWGYFNGSTWTRVTDIATAMPLPLASTNNWSKATALNSAMTQDATTSRMVGITIRAPGTGGNWAGPTVGEFVNVTVRFRRTDGLRGT